MFDLRKCLFVVCLLIIGFCTGYTINNIFNNIVEEKSKKSISWREKPVLVNCVDSLIEESTIKKAVNYWDRKGEKILFYHYQRQKEICDYNSLAGFITIKSDIELLHDESNVLAKTKKYMIQDKIISVEIFFKPGTFNYNLLLEHELGHAFGYNHKIIPGNIMHPTYDLMGPRL